MVSSCCAFGCKERHVKGGPVTFHSFPKDEVYRKLWTVQIRRANFKPTRYSKVCSKHFTADCFDREKFGGTWLKKDAVPTIFNFPSHLQEILQHHKILNRMSENTLSISENVELLRTPEKRKYYLGDFVEEDMNCPDEALIVLDIARKQRIIIMNLKRKQSFYEKKIFSLKQTVNELKKQLLLSKVVK